MPSSTLVVEAAEPTGSAPRWPTIDVVFKTRWWMLLDPPAATKRARHRCHPQNSVVDTAGPADSAPRGPAIDVIFKTR
jgi:hypothetical protein